MNFPTLFYKTPGTHHGPHGKTYDYIGVNNEEEAERFLADGWHADLDSACGVNSKEVIIDDSTPPTRDELKAKADELGIEYAKNIPSDKLESLINEAIEAGN